MGSLFKRSVRSVVVLSALAAVAACSESDTGISGVEPVGAAAAGKAKPTDITVSVNYLCGTFYGSGFTINPHCTGGPFGGFQFTSGTGVQGNIYITFASPVTSVTLTALDPDYSGNYMFAYDANNHLLAYVEFVGDNAPGSPSSSQRSVSYPYAAIKKVGLVPNSSDYIAYDNLSFY